jgi:hypothetical protein
MHTCRVLHYTEKCGLPARVRKAESLGRVDGDRRQALRTENGQLWAKHMADYVSSVAEVTPHMYMYIYIYACMYVYMCCYEIWYNKLQDYIRLM